MKILITGATGLVGKRLTQLLLDKGYSDLHALTRSKHKSQEQTKLPITFHQWNLEEGTIDQSALDNVDIVFNLAGENIAQGRWSQEKKEKILNSRVKGPELLLKMFEKYNCFPQKFISSSAVGIYGNRENEKLTTKSKLGNDFLSTICKKWEESVQKINNDKCKTYCLRTGVILSDKGGALTKMLPPFQAGVGGKLGSGNQYMSWIHLDDLASQFIFVMENEISETYLNAVSPNCVDNYEFTKTLGEVIHRPTLFPVPAIALKVLFGEMSCVLLDGQRAVPHEFIQSGYQFKYPSLKEALTHLLDKNQSNTQELLRYQFVNRSSEEIFTFFSQAKNLEELTPKEMTFKMTKMSTDIIQKGSIIDYQLRVHSIPMKWKAEILEYKQGEYFIDKQLSGPYSQWLHRHDFIKAKNGGTIIKDHVLYKVPLGTLGRFFAAPFINKDIDKIFSYRLQSVNKKFSNVN